MENYDIEICTDCLMWAANGAESLETETAAKLFALRWESAQLVPYPEGEAIFSHSECDGCGSALGGDRYMATVYCD